MSETPANEQVPPDACPRCVLLEQAIRDAEDGGRELQVQIDALNRALSTAEKRERVLQAKLERQHEEDSQVPDIKRCLAVWAEHCYAGTRKPSIGMNSKRAEQVRAALKWQRIGPDDICDAFRGLGLLPYQGDYGVRSAVPKPGFARKTDVIVALRDESRLERFRDYWRRVQASPADRLREQWQQVAAVADQLLNETMRANARQERDSQLDDARQHGHLFVIDGEKGKEAA